MPEDPSEDRATDTIPEKKSIPAPRFEAKAEFDEEEYFDEEEVEYSGEEVEDVQEEGGDEIEEEEIDYFEEDEDDSFAPRPANDELEDLLGSIETPALPAVRDHRKLRQATAAMVQDGMSLEDAAEEFGVEADDLHVWHRTYIGFSNKQSTDGTREDGSQRTEKVEIDSRSVVRFNKNWEEMIRIAEVERPQISNTRRRLMNFPLTGWMFRGETVDKVAVTGALAVMMFSFLAVKLAADHRGANDADDKKPPATRKEAMQIDGEQTIKEAADALLKFAEKKHWKDRLPYIRDSKTLEPAMEKYYKSNEDFLLGKVVVSPPGQYIKRKNGNFVFFRGNYKKDGELKPIAFMIEVTDKAPKFLFDWQVMVNYQPIPWKEFSKSKVEKPAPFRVRVKKGDYFNHPFMDEDKFLSFKLELVGEDDPIYGFTPIKSAAGSKISELLEKEYSENRAMILNLRYPEDAKLDNVLEIESVVTDGWLGD